MPRKTITLVQLNDSHAYLEPHPGIFYGAGGLETRPVGGYARIATLLNQVRAEGRPVLFCDGGDTLHGTYPAVTTRGQAVIPALNALAPAAMTAHWEFAYTPPVAQENAHRLNFPMLAANIYDVQTGRRPFPATLVQETGDVRVGLIGLASNIVDKTMPPHFSTGLRFTLGKEELRECIADLRTREQVDLVVLISHLGFPQDVQLMQDVPGVDVCLSGHTHHRLERTAMVGATAIIQSGCHGDFLGRLDLALDDGRVSAEGHALLEVSGSLPEDPVVRDLVEEALRPHRAVLREVVGETRSLLHRSAMLESPMDQLLLLALRAAAGTELAFSNGWRYGAPVPPGPITLSDLYNMTPMNPPLSTTRLTGQELREMLEENLEHTFSRDPYRQMGGYLKRCLGLRAYVKLENPPGQRIQALFVGEQPVQPEREYQAAFITAQGVPQKYGTQRTEHAARTVDLVHDFLRKHGPFEYQPRRPFIVV